MIETPGSMPPCKQESAAEFGAVDCYVDQAAALLGLALSNEYRPGVIAAFAAFRTAANLLLEFPMPAEMEPASVYSFGEDDDDR
jgi:hypothetical protein